MRLASTPFSRSPILSDRAPSPSPWDHGLLSLAPCSCSPATLLGAPRFCLPCLAVASAGFPRGAGRAGPAGGAVRAALRLGRCCRLQQGAGADAGEGPPLWQPWLRCCLFLEGTPAPAAAAPPPPPAAAAALGWMHTGHPQSLLCLPALQAAALVAALRLLTWLWRRYRGAGAAAFLVI